MRRIAPFLLALLLLLPAGVARLPLGRRVTLSTKEGETLYARRVPAGQYVWILYDHSVNKSLVEDGYEPFDGGLRLRATRFRHYGAGIPEPEAGQVFTDHGDYYEITGYDIRQDAFLIRVGRVADHRIRVGEDGAVVHFRDLAAPGTLLALSADSWTILKEIAWRCRQLGQG